MPYGQKESLAFRPSTPREIRSPAEVPHPPTITERWAYPTPSNIERGQSEGWHNWPTETYTPVIIPRVEAAEICPEHPEHKMKYQYLAMQDSPNVLIPLAIEPGRRGEPYALRTWLGRTINGPVTTQEQPAAEQVFTTRSDSAMNAKAVAQRRILIKDYHKEGCSRASPDEETMSQPSPALRGRCKAKSQIN